MRIDLWHGGRRWSGAPEIRIPRAGRHQCGPGMYFTTKYERAAMYAKGGGVTTRVTLQETICWLEDIKLPLGALQAYVRGSYGMRNKQKILDGLDMCSVDMAGAIPVAYLVNLCLDHGAASGKQGLRLAEWLVDLGIDASLHSVNREEQWVVMFNTNIICQSHVVSASTVSLADRAFPLIRRNEI